MKITKTGTGKCVVEGVGVAIHEMADDFVKMDDGEEILITRLMSECGAEVIAKYEAEELYWWSGIDCRESNGDPLPKVYRVRMEVSAVELTPDEAAEFWRGLKEGGK